MKYEKIILLLIAVTLTVITELDLLPQIHRMGFYCGDPKLSYKYNGDTVTARYLLLLSFLMPLLILADKHFYQATFSTFLMMYVTFIIGYCLCISSVNFLKILFGEPRPHFFDTCKPKELETCTAGSYVSEFTCTNSHLRQARDSTKSFPSGHSALSTFSAGFVLLYISNKTSNMKLFVQALCVLWILSCTVTRIFDHRHHWWDVLSGIAYGMGVSVLTLR